MDVQPFDIVVIGAGIGGASAAAHLAADYRVALVEAEEVAGYHATGRSAALWLQNYGPEDVRILSRLSRPFFEAPPAEIAAAALMHPRPVLFLAPETQRKSLRSMLAKGQGMRELPLAELRALVPAMRPGYIVAGAIEDDAFGIDVAGLHQGFLRQMRGRGGVLALRSRAGRIERKGRRWHVEVTGGAVFTGDVVVNAAGAWGDEVAGLAGAAPLGLRPKRRTAVIIDPQPWDVQHWPMINDVDHTWYTKVEARTKLLVSPADETDMPPHDVQPDELDVAIAIDRMQQALDIPVRRVEHSWAGLRTFTPDRSLAIGWGKGAEKFFWHVGQGGYGIQTSPAAGRLIADLIGGRDPGPAAAVLPRVDPGRFAG